MEPLSALALLGGLVALGTAISAVPRLVWRRRVRRAKLMPIAQAKGGRVALRGRVAAGASGPLTTPLCGRQAVWARSVVEEEFESGLGSDSSRSWFRQTIEKVESVPFVLVDEAGGRAHVRPRGASMYYGSMRIAVFARDEVPDNVREFMAADEMRLVIQYIGTRTGKVRCCEEIVAVDDELFVEGPSELGPGPPVQDGYRSGTSSELVLARAPDAELVMCGLGVAALPRRVWVASGVGIACALLYLVGALSQ